MKAFWLVLLAASAFADELPLLGISHVAFRVSDLEKARGFYTRELGYPEAFDMKNAAGGVAISFLKVNDDQYIELQPGLKPDENVRMTHVCFLTSSAEKLHAMLRERGLAPTELRPPGKDGNRTFRIMDPENNPIEFVEYLPGSLHSNARGKFAPGLSPHIRHAGIPVKDLEKAMAFYRDKLGFIETWRGGPDDKTLRWVNLKLPASPAGDYIELMLHDGNPSRQQLGSMLHICLDTDDIQKSWHAVVERGQPDDEKARPRVGRKGHWQFSLFDPDGSRVEFMEPWPAKK